MSSLASYRYLLAIWGQKRSLLHSQTTAQDASHLAVSHQDGPTEVSGSRPQQRHQYLGCILVHGVVSWLHEAPPT